MTVHANSLLAFRKLNDSGALAEQEARSMREIILNGPGTSRELDRRIGHGGRAWHPCFHRLERRGLLAIVGKRECAVSGHIASIYAWTGRTDPLPYRKPPTPTREELSDFLAFIGDLVPDDFSKVLDWLEYRSQ